MHNEIMKYDFKLETSNAHISIAYLQSKADKRKSVLI